MIRIFDQGFHLTGSAIPLLYPSKQACRYEGRASLWTISTAGLSLILPKWKVSDHTPGIFDYHLSHSIPLNAPIKFEVGMNDNRYSGS